MRAPPGGSNLGGDVGPLNAGTHVVTVQPFEHLNQHPSDELATLCLLAETLPVPEWTSLPPGHALQPV